jgi:hypothetical protein
MATDREARKNIVEQAKTHKELQRQEKTNINLVDKNLVTLSKCGN